MLLTFIYWYITYKQSRKLTLVKEKLYNILKNDNASILFRNVPEHMLKKHEKQVHLHRPLDVGVSPPLCSNFQCAEIKESLWTVSNDRELSIVHPQQRVFVHHLISFPTGNIAYPFPASNTFEITTPFGLRQHFIVQAEREFCDFSSSHTIQLQDYGLIKAWAAESSHVYFYLETDIDHIVDFFITVMQRQYCINNCLKLIRVLSVLHSYSPMEGCSTTCSNNHNMFGVSFDNPAMEYDSQLFMSNTEPVPKYVSKNNVKSSKEGPFFSPLPSPSNIPSSNIPSSNIPSSNIPSSLPRNLSSHLPPFPKKDFPLHSKEDSSPVLQKPPLQKDLSENSPKDLGPGDFFSEDDSEMDEIYDEMDEENETSDENNSADVSLDPDFFIEKEDNFTSDEEKLFQPYLREIKPNSPTLKGPRSPRRFSFMITIYSENKKDAENVKEMFENVLQNPYRYCVCILTETEVHNPIWIDNVGLLVVVGHLNDEFIKKVVSSVTRGSKVLALCSNILHTVLPMFKTAEVYENKLVKFSYGKYKNIDVVHDVVCYQASPVHARFSQENEDTKASEVKLPETIEMKDDCNQSHTFNVTELGREETWKNPSILVVTQPETYGKIVFSQIRLEIDPTRYADEKKNVTELEKGNEARFDIVRDLLENQFGMDLRHERVEYSLGYCLGITQIKNGMLSRLKDRLTADNILVMPKLKIKFYKPQMPDIPPSSTFLPILLHMCPPNFSTLRYYNALKTKQIGRVIIYSDVLMSSMNVLGTKLHHGLAIVTRQQTRGTGRHTGKTWLSPKGCAMFSLQLHIPKESCLGKHITILQHVVAVAVVKAIRQKPGYEKMPLRLKWPNDIYVDRRTKIGGLIVNTQVEKFMHICNIGVGVNLDNDMPTMCINDMIAHYNKEKENYAAATNTKPPEPLKKIDHEEFLASIFNQLEILIDDIQKVGHLGSFRDFYRKYWIHQGAIVTVTLDTIKYETFKGKIVGIDDDGFLLVQKKDRKIHIVHPDGNGFDSLIGLILPKM